MSHMTIPGCFPPGTDPFAAFEMQQAIALARLIPGYPAPVFEHPFGCRCGCSFVGPAPSISSAPFAPLIAPTYDEWQEEPDVGIADGW